MTDKKEGEGGDSEKSSPYYFNSHFPVILTILIL